MFRRGWLIHPPPWHRSIAHGDVYSLSRSLPSFYPVYRSGSLLSIGGRLRTVLPCAGFSDAARTPAPLRSPAEGCWVQNRWSEVARAVHRSWISHESDLTLSTDLALTSRPSAPWHCGSSWWLYSSPITPGGGVSRTF
jgi:hypothetical protein